MIKINEARNYLIDIHNNYKSYTLQQVINKIDDNYNNIQQFMNKNIMISEEFNEIYFIANSELMYGIEEYDRIYLLLKMMSVIKKIIDD